MNGQTRKKKYKEISERDGEYCRCCGKLSTEVQLVIDHRDNNNANNSHTNLQLLCRSCNYLKNPRKRPFDLCVNNNTENIEESCLSKNRTKEPLFREFILHELDFVQETHSMKWEEAINSGAEKVGISPMTAERYLKKMTSKCGPLCKVSAYEHTIIYRRDFNTETCPRQW